jgi:IS605 OrfB family transposase
MARGKRKRDKRWMWVVKPGDKIVVGRTAVIPSKKLSRRGFSVLKEIVNIYSEMFRDVIPHAFRNIIESYYRLKNEKYHELRKIYPNIPSHHIHGLCRDAVERISSLRRNRARQYAEEIFDEDALRMRGVIVIGRISGDDIRIMIARYRDRQLRHRIYQSALKGELNAIIDKAREYDVPV